PSSPHRTVPMRARPLVLGLVALLAACDDDLYTDPTPGGVSAPENLTYEVDPNGDDDRPTGVLLLWDYDPDPDIAVWRVYSRASTADPFTLRGTTTSNSFHDSGLPHLDYEVTAESLDGIESGPSNTVRIDERIALDPPGTLGSVSLDGAVALIWSDAPALGNPAEFSNYRVYSASYDLDAGLCGSDWGLEGTSVSPEFVVGVLPNGVPRCFAVSTQHLLGYESLWSPIDDDTPRADARNLVLYTQAANGPQSGFSFWKDLDADGQPDPNELGIVGPASGYDLLLIDALGDPTFTVAGNVGLRTYVNGPVGDLTDIDIAPLGGYGSTPLAAQPGWGYVAEIDRGGPFPSYGAIRVTHVGTEFIILDWSYQADPGNPELVIR
ncbi:MAG TPA: hypothetical protein VJ773_04915, partial [Gemmatimonadales bacterium]|nr:hypothetical protein [Gemmatimonadales bacterium]